MNMVPQKHVQKSPFPFVKDGRIIATDEQCACLHPKTEHRDTLQYGHGACMQDECECRKFTWRQFIGGE